MTKYTKAALGTVPADLCAWFRIKDLAEAIIRQAEDNHGSTSLSKNWAREIIMQCDIIDEMKRNTQEKDV